MDPLQQIAKELGIPLGHDIPTAALEWIRKAQAELSRLRDERDKTMDTVVNLRAKLAGAEAEARVFGQELARLRSAPVAVERHPLKERTCSNCAQSGHCVDAQYGNGCEDHIWMASAPVAVEVPTLDGETYGHLIDAGIDGYANEAQRITEWFRSRIRAIDSSRIIKDGDRAVPVNLFNRVRSCLDRLINRDTDSYWRGESRRTLMELHAINTSKEGAA